MGTNEHYVARRKKEYLSFMVVRFLKAYEMFQEIYDTYQQCLSERSDSVRTQLFERIRNLEEKLIFDIKSEFK